MKVLMQNQLKYIARLSEGFLLITAVMVLFLVSPYAHARQDSPLDQLFTIRDIKLDESASSASRARQVALLKAEEEAYQKLLRKITQIEDRAMLPELSVVERQGLISGIEIVDEQSSSRRYLATMNVRFEPDRVSDFLASYNVPHVLGTGRPILVLHAHQRGLATLLWENDPIVKQARDDVDWVNRIRGYRFARGEIRERLAITASEVQSLNPDAAVKIGKINSLTSAVMISSQVTRSESGSPIVAFDYIATDSGVSGSEVIPLVDGDERAAMVAMFEHVLEVIDGAWRGRLLVDTGKQGELNVVVPSLSLDVLAEMERRLSAVTLVQSYKVRQVGIPLSLFYLRYTGREEQLALALRFEGLDLKPYGAQLMLELRN